MWCIILTGFCMLNHPCVARTNPTWSRSLCRGSDGMQAAPGAWLPAMWGWEMGSCYCAKSWNWLKSPQFTVQSFCWKLQTFNRLQSSKIVISERFCQCNCGLGGEINSHCFLLCHLSRILCLWVIFMRILMWDGCSESLLAHHLLQTLFWAQCLHLQALAGTWLFPWWSYSANPLK